MTLESRFWLGSYTSDSDGHGAGISLLRQEEAGTLQTLATFEASSPSWVTGHPTQPVVYAAAETRAAVQAFAVTDTGLRPLGSALEAGAQVCHLSVVGNGRALVASCWGDGRVVTVPLGANGSFEGEPIVAASSQDPYGAQMDDTAGAGENPFAELAVQDALAKGLEQRPSRAHTSLELPDGRLVTTDLGHDTLRFWSRSDASLREVGVVALPFGVGPRHLVLHRSGHLHVLTEHSNEVFTLAPVGDGTWRVVAAIVASADSIENGDAASEISISMTGEHLHTAIRGSNRISTIEVRGDGSELRAIADVESGGSWPRHHREDGGLLHVANQLSNRLVTLALDEREVPRTVVGSLETGSPTCITPV